jgi:hypothetical protein
MLIVRRYFLFIREYFVDNTELCRDFFKGRKGFKYIETDDKIVIKTPNSMIRIYKSDKCTDDEIIAKLKRIYNKED